MFPSLKKYSQSLVSAPALPHFSYPADEPEINPIFTIPGLFLLSNHVLHITLITLK
jgi:hypothetical protein